MALPSIYNHKKLMCALIIVALMLIGNGRTQQTNKQADNVEKPENKIPAIPEAREDQKTIKKELKVNKTLEDAAVILIPESDGHAEKIVLGENSVTETKEKISEVLKTDTNEKKNEIPLVKKTENTKISQSTTKSSSHIHHDDEEFIINDDEEISDSLATGFYFFLALSSGAVIFILFKIYRLRLSRAERKYGVQGDRSNQELTPLPLSIEDCHSDDEDHTLFEVQRQNIRIL